jgi:hypothetical protein
LPRGTWRPVPGAPVAANLTATGQQCQAVDAAITGRSTPRSSRLSRSVRPASDHVIGTDDTTGGDRGAAAAHCASAPHVALQWRTLRDVRVHQTPSPNTGLYVVCGAAVWTTNPLMRHTKWHLAKSTAAACKKSWTRTLQNTFLPCAATHAGKFAPLGPVPKFALDCLIASLRRGHGARAP